MYGSRVWLFSLPPAFPSNPLLLLYTSRCSCCWSHFFGPNRATCVRARSDIRGEGRNVEAKRLAGLNRRTSRPTYPRQRCDGFSKRRRAGAGRILASEGLALPYDPGRERARIAHWFAAAIGNLGPVLRPPMRNAPNLMKLRARLTVQYGLVRAQS